MVMTQEFRDEAKKIHDLYLEHVRVFCLEFGSTCDFSVSGYNYDLVFIQEIESGVLELVGKSPFDFRKEIQRMVDGLATKNASLHWEFSPVKNGVVKYVEKRMVKPKTKVNRYRSINDPWEPEC